MTNSDPDSTINITNRSGGANLNAGRDITIGGDVVGRDKIIIAKEVVYKVDGLANSYLDPQSFIYADHAKYAGHEKMVAETVTRLAAADDLLALLFVTDASATRPSEGRCPW